MAFQQQSVGEDCFMLSKTVARWLWVLDVNLSGGWVVTLK